MAGDLDLEVANLTSRAEKEKGLFRSGSSHQAGKSCCIELLKSAGIKAEAATDGWQASSQVHHPKNL